MFHALGAQLESPEEPGACRNTCFSFRKVKNLFTYSITVMLLPPLLTTAIKKLHKQWKTEQDAKILPVYVRQVIVLIKRSHGTFHIHWDFIFLSLHLNDPNIVIMDACNFFPSSCLIPDLNHNAEIMTSLSIISTWLHL